MFGSQRSLVVVLVLHTWLAFTMHTATCILPKTVVPYQNEETGKSYVYRFGEDMSYEELVSEMIEMRKELNSQNERIQFQEKRIDNQDKKILLLESLHSENDKIDDERIIDNNPTYDVNLFMNAKKNNNYVIEREKRGLNPSNYSSLNSSSLIGSKYIKLPPRLCTSLFDPERPDAAILTRGKLIGEPSSCYELRLNGHYLNGFYSVKNDGNIETIFCNFSVPTVEVSKNGNKSNNRLCTSLYDPEHPDASFPIKKNFTGEPTNCFDLHLIGHYLNGYYSVKNINGNIETVSCNFSEPNKTGVVKNDLSPTTKVIVTSDVKPGPSSFGSGVHFFVQRNSPTPTMEGTILFQIERLNIGGAFDKSTGIFSAPKNGVYHFAFSGMMKSGTGKLYVLLRRNMNEKIAVAHGDVGADTNISPMISFTATARLQKNDLIDLYKSNDSGRSGGILYDSNHRCFITSYVARYSNENFT